MDRNFDEQIQWTSGLVAVPGCSHLLRLSHAMGCDVFQYILRMIFTHQAIQPPFEGIGLDVLVTVPEM